MANALRTFQPGEKIKASETNENNQFLLDKITDSAAQLQAYIEQEIAELQGSFIQPGFIIGLSHDTVPIGFLKCDGSELLIEDYPELYDAIGTIYGSSDSTSFKLPDFRGKFLRGYGGSSASIGTVQLSAAPNITGQLTTSSWAKNEQGALFKAAGGSRYGEKGYGDGGAFGFDASRSSSIYQNDVTEIRPENMAVTWIIKY